MDKTLDLLAHHISYFKSVDKIVLFGSRARGDHHDRSDYDIAIFGSIPKEDRNEITFYTNEGVRTLLKIDCVFVQFLEPDSKIMQNINKEGIVIYERK